MVLCLNCALQISSPCLSFSTLANTSRNTNSIPYFLYIYRIHSLCFVNNKQTLWTVQIEDSLLLTCPGSVQFQAVSRDFFRLQTQNPLDRKKHRPAFFCHRRHNYWSGWLINTQPLREGNSWHAHKKNYTETPQKIIPEVDFLPKVLWTLNSTVEVSAGSVWGTCEAAGRQTAECWFKWEWRIYTGHQLELRSGFPCEWESLRFLTAANLCWVCVCYWNIYIFSFIVKSFNSANREYFTNFAASVGAVMYLCTWVFPHVTLWERMCEITTRNLFKKTITGVTWSTKASLCPFLLNYQSRKSV